MPIEILQSPPIGKASYTFSFKNPVIEYAIGLSAFKVTYGLDDHWVRSLSIGFLPGLGSGIGDTPNDVYVIPQIVMVDDSNNSAKVADSVVIAVCIAVTKSPDPNTVIHSAKGLSSGKDSPVAVPPLRSGYTIGAAFQAGFTLSYTSDDHQLLTASAGCGIESGESTGMSIVPSANLQDLHNVVQVATVDAGYIVSSSSDLGLGSQHVQAQTHAATNVPMEGMKSISTAVAVIQDWKVRFKDVHNVQTITVGAWGQLTANGNTVTIPGLYADICDTSKNTQDDDQSHCSVLVLALP